MRKHMGFMVFFLGLAWIPAPAVLFSAEPPKLAKIDKNGIVIEYLPKMEPLAKKVHTWLGGHLAKNPFDMNKDLKKLQESQAKITDYLCKQLDRKTPSETLEKTIPELFTKFQNAGNVIPNIRHLHLWNKKDLKDYLDNGGKIPGYSYRPGPEGENELLMEKAVQSSGSEPAKPVAVLSPLFPLILKSPDPDKYYDEAVETLTQMHQQFRKMSSGMAGVILMMSIQSAIQEELRPPMRFFNWFSSGLAGFLTGQILNDFISEETAKNFSESQSIRPFVKIAPQIHLVKWIGSESKDKPKTVQSEILKKARYSFSIYEVMRIVGIHGPDSIPKIFAQIHKAAPLDPKKSTKAVDESQFTGEQHAAELEILLTAIETAIGEDFRPRLIQYSQIPLSEDSPSSDSSPTEKDAKKP